MTTRQQQLERIEQELARQNAAWERTKQALATLGNVHLAVPQSVLEQLEAPALSTVPPVVGIRA